MFVQEDVIFGYSRDFICVHTSKLTRVHTGGMPAGWSHTPKKQVSRTDLCFRKIANVARGSLLLQREGKKVRFHFNLVFKNLLGISVLFKCFFWGGGGVELFWMIITVMSDLIGPIGCWVTHEAFEPQHWTALAPQSTFRKFQNQGSTFRLKFLVRIQSSELRLFATWTCWPAGRWCFKIIFFDL